MGAIIVDKIIKKYVKEFGIVRSDVNMMFALNAEQSQISNNLDFTARIKTQLH
jgi:hypothetical protein